MIVVLIYGAILILLTWPVLSAAFPPFKEGSVSRDGVTFQGLLEVLRAGRYWLLWGIFVAAQGAMLVIPVRAGSRRPVTRQSILVPIVTAGFLMAALVAAAICTVQEVFIKNPGAGLFISTGPSEGIRTKDALFGMPMMWLPLAAFILTWLLWGCIFFRWSKHLEPKAFIEKQCRTLFRGSVLELLIAVPTHVFVRSRDYCCAGFSTFIGIAVGLVVMILSFGPGIVFLYAERLSRVKR